MKVFVMTNEKGGVGKTTTAVTVATMLNERGHKTLLIDANPSGNASSTYRAKKGKGDVTLYDVILADEDERVPINEAIQTPEKDGTIGDVIASDKLLKTADAILLRYEDGVLRLREALRGLEGYEYVVIDTPQGFGTILRSCLIAADSLVIPVLADEYSKEGMSELSAMISGVKKAVNPNLEIDGILLARVKNTRLRKILEKEFHDIADKFLGTRVYRSAISDCKDVPESQRMRMGLNDYNPKCKAAIEYADVVSEILGEEKKDGEE